jgi:hypothetical protein
MNGEVKRIYYLRSEGREYCGRGVGEFDGIGGWAPISTTSLYVGTPLTIVLDDRSVSAPTKRPAI